MAVKLHNLLLIMVVVFAVIQLGMDRFPNLAILFNVIGVGTLIPLFFVLLASFKQARKDRIMWLWLVAPAILAVVAFTFIRDWGLVWSQLVYQLPHRLSITKSRHSKEVPLQKINQSFCPSNTPLSIRRSVSVFNYSQILSGGAV